MGATTHLTLSGLRHRGWVQVLALVGVCALAATAVVAGLAAQTSAADQVDAAYERAGRPDLVLYGDPAGLEAARRRRRRRRVLAAPGLRRELTTPVGDEAIDVRVIATDPEALPAVATPDLVDGHWPEAGDEDAVVVEQSLVAEGVDRGGRHPHRRRPGRDHRAPWWWVPPSTCSTASGPPATRCACSPDPRPSRPWPRTDSRPVTSPPTPSGIRMRRPRSAVASWPTRPPASTGPTTGPTPEATSSSSARCSPAWSAASASSCWSLPPSWSPGPPRPASSPGAVRSACSPPPGSPPASCWPAVWAEHLVLGGSASSSAGSSARRCPPSSRPGSTACSPGPVLPSPCARCVIAFLLVGGLLSVSVLVPAGAGRASVAERRAPRRADHPGRRTAPGRVWPAGLGAGPATRQRAAPGLRPAGAHGAGRGRPGGRRGRGRGQPRVHRDPRRRGRRSRR